MSLAAVIALLVGMGLMLLGGETGRGGGLSKEMVSKFGAAIAALIVIAGATGITNFFS